ncbi:MULTISPECIES: hypothetical protein [unclassified Streptomyces]|uniref:hypothetical protein n=1 Tax=unclassified Streptomyces TaxID=2593676 RepID=UPI00093B3EA8|nr:hypothetical protein [Streptomyces sp. CB02058]OKI97718.1 hypothetical protein AMK10_02485 [Streptomyces sp. CB02058]
MPAPEREVQPQSSRAEPPPVSAVSMKDLLASCAAATAVSTPPRDEQAGEDDEDAIRPVAGRDAA